MPKSPSPTPINRVPRTLNGFPPHRSAKGPVKRIPPTRKGDGANAAELFTRQPSPSAKIHTEGRQEYRHEIHRNSETHNPGVAKSQGICGIEFAILHADVPETSWPCRCQAEILAVRFYEL